MMKTYNAIQQEIEAAKAHTESLIKQAEEIRKAELAAVVQEIKAKMAEFGITVEDLGGMRKASAGKGMRGKVAAKWRDPVSGKTWTGRGRTPVWFAEAKAAGVDVEKFRI
jgi:DNA-binding protein H-NS